MESRLYDQNSERASKEYCVKFKKLKVDAEAISWRTTISKANNKETGLDACWMHQVHKMIFILVLSQFRAAEAGLGSLP